MAKKGIPLAMVARKRHLPDAHENILRQRLRESSVLELWRKGHDTVAIGLRLDMDEYVVESVLHSALEQAKASCVTSSA